MQTAKYVVFVFIFIGLVGLGCTTSKHAPIENSTKYQLEKGRNTVMIFDKGQFQWNKRKDTCEADYSFEGLELCFQYIGRPQYKVEILSEENKLAFISGIRRNESTLELEGKEYTLKPVKGNVTMYDQDQPIARIYQQKRKWYIKIVPEHDQNQILLAALIYKDWKWQITRSSYESVVI